MAAPSRTQLESLLTRALGRPTRIGFVESLPPWAVARCHNEPAPGAPPTVIAKWLRDHPTGLRTDPRQIYTEQAAYAFLAEIGFPNACRMIAADHAAGVLILEDLAPRVPLADRLRSDGAFAVRPELIAFAQTLGELGAATAGRERAYDRLRRQAGPLGGPAGHLAELDSAWPAARRRLEGLGLTMGDAAERDHEAVVTALADPGPFRAFSNGDPHPNNFLVGEGGGRLIDFEAAGFVHAGASAVWIHAPDPAWVTASQVMASELESAFRAALAIGVPEAEDDRRFGFGLAACCLAWALTRLARFDTLDGREAGDRSRLQMVATLELAVAAAKRHRALPALAGWAERVAAWLRRRWPDADIDVAGFPAFTPR